VDGEGAMSRLGNRSKAVLITTLPRTQNNLPEFVSFKEIKRETTQTGD
jgi:hypothetical protein